MKAALWHVSIGGQGTDGGQLTPEHPLSIVCSSQVDAGHTGRRGNLPCKASSTCGRCPPDSCTLCVHRSSFVSKLRDSIYSIPH